MRGWIVGTALALAACSGQSPSTGCTGSRMLTIRDFDAITLDSSDTVDVRRGEGYAIHIEGADEVRDRIDIRRDGNDLRIGRKGPGLWTTGDTSARIVVTMPAIRGATLTGSGDITIDQASEPFVAKLDGSGDMTLGQLQGDRATLTVSGSGTLAVAGSVRTIALSVAGSGKIDARQVRAGEATVSIAGSGDIAADINGPARVSVVGSGSATLGSGARCVVDRVGSGQVHCG